MHYSYSYVLIIVWGMSEAGAVIANDASNAVVSAIIIPATDAYFNQDVPDAFKKSFLLLNPM